MKKLIILTLLVVSISICSAQTNRPFSLKDIQQAETIVMYSGKVVASFVSDSSLTVIDSLGTIKSLIRGVNQHSDFETSLQQKLDAAILVLNHITPDGSITDKKGLIEDLKKYKDLVNTK